MNKRKIMDQLFEQKVVILFVILCVLTIIASKQPLTFVANELFTRIARNSFLVLALIIPVLAGMGLNFGIVIGAMAAQIAVFLTTHWGFVGIGGFLLTALLATPMAVFFGFLVGKLFNKGKGSELICGLVLGYFADGLYQLLFLFIFGGVIPINNPKLMIATGVGVKNTIDLKDTIKYSLDTVPMLTIVEIGFYIVVAAIVLSALIKLIQKQPVNWKKSLISWWWPVRFMPLPLSPRWRAFWPPTVCCFCGRWSCGSLLCWCGRLRNSSGSRSSARKMCMSNGLWPSALRQCWFMPLPTFPLYMRSSSMCGCL